VAVAPVELQEQVETMVEVLVELVELEEGEEALMLQLTIPQQEQSTQAAVVVEDEVFQEEVQGQMVALES
jgi:hypothetical protein